MGFPLGIYSQEEREGESGESTLQENKPQQDKEGIQESALVFLLE